MADAMSRAAIQKFLNSLILDVSIVRVLLLVLVPAPVAVAVQLVAVHAVVRCSIVGAVTCYSISTCHQHPGVLNLHYPHGGLLILFLFHFFVNDLLFLFQ